MRHLYLLRHAKSGWDDESLDDHDRPLEPRGERACEAIGPLLARAVPGPQLALCSSARRAVDTMERVLTHLSPVPPLRIDASLYLAGTSDLRAALAQVEERFSSVLMVGHNPGMHQLAVELAGEGDAEALEKLGRKLPTAALVELRLAGDDWSQTAPGAGRLVRFARPRDLGVS